MKPRILFRTLALAALLSFLASPHAGTAAPVPALAGTIHPIRLNEVLFYPLPGQSEWVELKNNGAAPVEISAYALTEGDGHDYLF